MGTPPEPFLNRKLWQWPLAPGTELICEAVGATAMPAPWEPNRKANAAVVRRCQHCALAGVEVGRASASGMNNSSSNNTTNTTTMQVVCKTLNELEPRNVWTRSLNSTYR